MASYHIIKHICALNKYNECHKKDVSNDDSISQYWFCNICGEEDLYDKCSEDIRYRCGVCNYNVCENCYEKHKTLPTIHELDEEEKEISLRYVIHNKSGKLKLPKHKFKKILSNILNIHKPVNIYTKYKNKFFSFRTNEIISEQIYDKLKENDLEIIDCRE